MADSSTYRRSTQLRCGEPKMFVLGTPAREVRTDMSGPPENLDRPSWARGVGRRDVIERLLPRSLAAALLPMLLACGDGSAGTLQPPEAASNQIAFSSMDSLGFNIYVADADGQQRRQLTNTRYADAAGDWSPDGSRLVFSSNRAGDHDIYTMRADGSDVRQLTTDSGVDADPIWSPDGRKIAWKAGRKGTFDVWVMNADGSNPVNVSNTPQHFAYGHEEDPIAWSPDSREVMYWSDRSPWGIYVGRADGSGDRLIVPSLDADWSPDGRTVAFSQVVSGKSKIFTVPIEGGEPTQLSPDEGDVIDGVPVYSPDGNRIAFVRLVGYDEYLTDIWVMNRDGTGVRRLTHAVGYDHQPRWSANGEYIGFLSRRNGSIDIYVMDADGSNQHPVNDPLRSSLAHTWRP